MAKQTFPGIKTSGGLLRKVVGVLVMLAVLAFIVKRPSDAADWLKAMIDGGEGVVDSVATFFQQVSA
jgi:hypothetical protein